MILDALTQVMTDQTLAANGTRLSANTIDLRAFHPAQQKAQFPDIGAGEAVAMVFHIKARGAGGTDPFTFNVVTDDNDDLSDGPSVVQSRAVLSAEVVAGARIVVDVPTGMQADALKRYLGASVAVPASVTGLIVTAGLVPRSFIPFLRSYASGYVID